MTEELLFSRTFNLAKRGCKYVSPNPMVGALLYDGKKIIAEGYHQKYGSHHAEVNCISQARQNGVKDFSKLTMYVSLEPCDHHGNTPPCSKLLIEAGIKTVFIACEDPNPLVAGKGIKRMKDNGIDVNFASGEIQKIGQYLNRAFFVQQTLKRPYIILKFAQDQGFTLGLRDEQTQISGKFAQILNHKWRSESDAILVGYNTAKTDNPSLTDRHFGGPQPLRCVIDRQGSLPSNLTVFNDEQETLIYQAQQVEDNITERITIDFDNEPLTAILADLHKRKVQSLIIEGGAKTLNLFYNAGLWDEARIITSTENVKGDIKAPTIKGNQHFGMELSQDSISIIFNPLTNCI